MRRFLHTVWLIGALALPAYSQSRRVVPGHVVPATARLQPRGALPPTNRLTLRLGLSLRNQPELEELLGALQSSASTNFHRWLTSEQFTERFGPTIDDYEKVVRFANQHGFEVTKIHSNRMMVTVEAPVSKIETAFNLRLRRYPHPKENRTFYAPDADPTVEASVPLLHIAGLDDFIRPHRLGGGLRMVPLNTNQIVSYATGSSPGGFFMGNDFRQAYVPGVTNTGAGQYIAIVDVGGPYYPNDIYRYETNAGLSTNISITNILLSGWTGIPTGTTDNEGEEVLDIDMAMSMAPDAVILNYEGEAHDVFNQIAVDNQAKQMTLSYGFGIDSIIQQIFQQFVAQGQAMSQASGDGGADLDGGTGLTGAPYSTIVGGTSLTTRGPGGAWQSENTWGGSGGGISGYGIPTWQQGINMTANLGSVSYRNYPDVAMPADNIFTVYKNGTAIGATGGTSAASPLWAGFMALVNQQAAAQGNPPVGFVNPAIYATGKGPRSIYTSCFHDIATGNTYNSQNPNRYAALPGYDLCTGWGSPTGSNTINSLVGTGTNDFIFFPSQGAFHIVAGGTANATVTLTRMNGLAGSVTFSIAGLPAGVTAFLSPASTSNATSLTLTTLGQTAPGRYSAALTGTMGSLTHSVTLSIVILAPVPGAVPVNLASLYNRAGIYSDGRTFGGGLDAAYSSFSANLLGPTLSWNGLVFSLGPANTLDVVACARQTLNLPAGNFTSLQMLGTAVQGSQAAQSFTLAYTDNSTATITQSFSDWANPQSYVGEFTVFTMPYRNLNSGSSQSLNVSVYGYSLTLDGTKILKSITLPSNADLVLLSAVLANEPVSVPLAAYYNRAGIYTDGTTFTNPATGGLDGGGAAYSGTLLGGSRTWSNTPFNFGPANATNVISANNQTISLRAGNYAALRLLATGVQGSQVAQALVVTYTDSTSATMVQSFSDWFSPQNYAGESKAVTMGHRDSSDGSTDNRTFYLYGYSFPLNSAKTIQSIRLPKNANLIVAAISLIPNWPPTFNLNPFTLPDADAGNFYSGTILTNVSDLNGDTLTCAKVSGPAWLDIAANGTVSGTPADADANTNTFVVGATDPGGLSTSATLYLNVRASPRLLSTISASGTNLLLNWSGGIAPYQVQVSRDLGRSGWINFGGTLNTNSLILAATNPASFYRLIGQ